MELERRLSPEPTRDDQEALQSSIMRLKRQLVRLLKVMMGHLEKEDFVPTRPRRESTIEQRKRLTANVRRAEVANDLCMLLLVRV